MKAFFTACIIMICLSSVASAAEQKAVEYDGVVLNEDSTWRGYVIVRGFVVVAPQTTLRIDPGTVIHFASDSSRQLPSLIVQGRIHAAGTAEHPIILTSDRSKAGRGSWGGLVFLSTEKRNLLEQCRIEYAETGIDLQFSTLTLQGVSIVQTRTALMAHDSVVQMSGGTVTDAETGIEMHNSELDARETTVASCQRGYLLSKSAVALTSSKIINNRHTGFEADECRIKITGGGFSGNATGARITGGEGQIFMSRFLKNGQTALSLSGSRIKIQRCLFVENEQDAIKTEGGRPLFQNNAFSSNGGFNIYNAGHEVVAARQNWWGSANQQQIAQKIYDTARDGNAGAVLVFPWLTEMPQLMP
ncbi:MAG: right-handed parallel beta-helix repeat-containing protein [Desulfuromonadaceae bacterium]|nr:right-handed parallel beta-helix repeat-containing protein [Desulfuromonadaceae bacterium]MDD5105848.1 right-handed parallel beta-helix repeat-containing protein [Desulfuromonadaceae bacterium]